MFARRSRFAGACSVLIPLVLAAGTPAVAVNTSQTSSQAQEMPDAFEIARQARADAIRQHPQLVLQPWAPNEVLTDALLVKEVRSSFGGSDPVEKVTVVARRPGREYAVSVKQENRVQDTPVVSFVVPNAPDPNNNTTDARVCFDADIFAVKTVVITPMLRPASGGQPREFGKSVTMPSWDERAPERLFPVGWDGTCPTFGLSHTGHVTVKPRRQLRAGELRSGRFYIRVEQTCLSRKRAYGGYDWCRRAYQVSYRVRQGHRTTHVTGVPSAPGDLLARRPATKQQFVDGT
jgi:hypothetical protein